jgi:Ca2+-binding EF-hand superfamily protein
MFRSKPYIKAGSLYKTEVKKLIAATIAKANNNQHESMLLEHDKDQDDYLNIDELISFISAMAQ